MARVSIQEKVQRLVDEVSGDDAVALVEEYVASDQDNRPKFTGREFERLGGGGDAGEVANRFTADDLVALSLLGVPVPGAPALALLDETRGWPELLGKIPTGLSVVDEAGRRQLCEEDSAANQLWTAIQAVGDMGPTRTGKLLARKRPRLLPVYDNVIDRAIQPNTSWWKIIAQFFADADNTRRVEDIRAKSGAEGYLSVLRTLDVVIWMRHRGPVEG